MKHIVKLEAGYDCIKFECKHGSKDCVPGAGGSHGRHGLNILFVSKGDKGAVQFLIFTGRLPQYEEPGDIGFRIISDWGEHMMPTDLGVHSKTPIYDGQKPTQPTCEYTDGPCYYDGSGLNANTAMYALVNGGEEGLWKFLDAYYESICWGGKHPEPCEYPMPVRKHASARRKHGLRRRQNTSKKRCNGF